MPYAANRNLPAPVRHALPTHAQDIYRQAFNHAFAAHAGAHDRDERAHRIAWGAVKKCYAKFRGQWQAREES